jgi:hypothetical protein
MIFVPIIVRRKHASHRQLSSYRRRELLTGTIAYAVHGYDGYGDGRGTNLRDFISDEMRADWKAHRDELMAFWATGEAMTKHFDNNKPWRCACGRPDAKPWAARTLR